MARCSSLLNYEADHNVWSTKCPEKGTRMAGRIIIDAERCKGCSLCVVVCPKGCITISAQSNKSGYFPAQTTNADCTGCAMCAIVCPETIIEVYRDRPDSIEIVTVPGTAGNPSAVEEKV